MNIGIPAPSRLGVMAWIAATMLVIILFPALGDIFGGITGFALKEDSHPFVIWLYNDIPLIILISCVVGIFLSIFRRGSSQ